MKSVLAVIGPAISQVSTVTNMSTPLQADLTSVVEKGARDARCIANFLGQPTRRDGQVGARGGGEFKVYVYEEARVKQERQRYKQGLVGKENKKSKIRKTVLACAWKT